MANKCTENAEQTCRSYPLCYGCNAFRNPTNYDSIRNMSIDEMAEFISKEKPFCGYSNGGIDCVFGWSGGNCAEHAKEWLERGVE